MEFLEPQVRHCKKSFPSCIPKRNPEVSGDFVQKREHREHIDAIFHVHGYNSSLSSQTLARGFVASLKGVQWVREECSGGEVQSL
jgi:hypothetical protein